MVKTLLSHKMLYKWELLIIIIIIIRGISVLFNIYCGIIGKLIQLENSGFDF